MYDTHVHSVLGALTANKMTLGVCSRSKDVIEPRIKPQWWVNCKSMAARSVAAVRNGDLKLVPSFHETTWCVRVDVRVRVRVARVSGVYVCMLCVMCADCT